LVWAAGDRAGSGGNAIALGALAVHKKISNQVRRQSGPIREPIMSRIARTSRYSRRTVLAGASAGLAGILATGRAPAFAQTAAKKLVFAHLNAEPESAAVAFAWMAKEATKRSKGELDVQFYGSTLLNKELEIMNAVKSGNIAIGNPGGAAATVFPEMGVFLVPYLVRSYDQAYRLFNGKIGERLDAQFQEKYKVKVLCFFDYGFRHFWNSKRPINEPKDLRGMKLRVQQAKVFGDTINGLGGNAVPMPWGEVIPAAQQGVIDGADLPIVNILALKVLRGLQIRLAHLPQLRPDGEHDQSRRVERTFQGPAEAPARRVARGAGAHPP
jgi:hypothetical protein